MNDEYVIVIKRSWFLL